MEDPYLIQTAEQLNAVRQGPKCHYKLIADIDLSKWGNWVPIGGTESYGFLGGGWNKAEKGAHSFQGSFDGNGHVVSGMQIMINEETPFLTESGNWRAYGLFASLATNPVEYKIKNLGVVNFNIDVNYTNVKEGLDLYVAAIVGGLNNGTDIVNCYSKGGITPYGKEYVRNCTANGNSVTGAAWAESSTLNVVPVTVGTLTDLTSDAWYAEAVKWALDKGIISGTTFSPEKTCTRAQLITFLWNASGAPKMSDTNPFSDVKSTDSHYDAVLWASEKGIVNGSTFAPQTSLNRGELVISLWKSLDCPEGLQANQYLDIESHQSDFGRAVAWSHINGVMGGTGKYKFSPKKTCTKAQVINYIYRALK